MLGVIQNSRLENWENSCRKSRNVGIQKPAALCINLFQTHDVGTSELLKGENVQLLLSEHIQCRYELT